MAEEPGRIKVMALVPTLGAGGAERFISLLVGHLDRSLFTCELVMLENVTAYPLPPDVPRLVIESEPQVCPARRIELPQILEAEHADAALWLSSVAAKLERLVQRQQPDVIVSSPLWAAILASVAQDGFPASTRLINRVDAPPSVSLAGNPDQALFAHLITQHFNAADCIVAVSQGVEDDLVENFHLDSARIQVLHNPVDAKKIRAMANEPVEDPWFDDSVPVVLFVGRLDRVKGLEYLLRAVARVTEVRPVRCVLVGDGEHRGYLRALAKHLGIADQVRFAGHQPNPFKFLERADVFVLPSLSEGMPNVLLEAMTCGCPVIASDIKGGITREVLLDGECGIIVPRQDAGALAAAILEMLGDERLRERFKRRGLERAAEFDLPKIIRLYQDLILTVADKPVGESPGAVMAPNSPGQLGSRAASGGGRQSEATAGVARRPGASQTHVSHSRPTAPSGGGPRRGARHIAGLVNRVLRVSASWVRDAVSRVGSRSTQSAVRTGEPSRTRLLIVVPSMDDRYMGMGTLPLLRHINRDEFDVSLVRLVHTVDSGGVPGDIDQLVVRAVRGQSRTVTQDLPEGIAARHKGELRRLETAAHGLSALARNQGADVILAQGFYASIVAATSKRSMPMGAAVIANFHSRAHDFADASHGGDLYTALICQTLGSADAVIAPDEGVRNDLLEKFGVAAGLVTVLPDPIEVSPADTDDRSRPCDHPWLGQPGVFVVSDDTSITVGYPLLLEALALARRHEPVRCILLAEQRAQAGMMAAAEHVGVLEAVGFIGCGCDPMQGNPTALIHVSAAAEIDVPDSLVAAVASGCPIISTKGSRALDEFLGHGERGLLVPPADAQSLADAMLQMVWDDEGRVEMARKATAYLDTVSADVMIPRIESLISKVVQA